KFLDRFEADRRVEVTVARPGAGLDGHFAPGLDHRRGRRHRAGGAQPRRDGEVRDDAAAVPRDGFERLDQDAPAEPWERDIKIAARGHVAGRQVAEADLLAAGGGDVASAVETAAPARVSEVTVAP